MSAFEKYPFVKRLGIAPVNGGVHDGSQFVSTTTAGREYVVASYNPASAEPVAHVAVATPYDYEVIAQSAVKAFAVWRRVPAPKRGLIVRDIADALRAAKKDLGALISLEVGKIRAEGEGEVQEMIDVADFAVGLSRQLYGITMPSERPGHRLEERWQPLGPVGVITAFNFPAAVWSWNAFLAMVCGDTVIWKPSLKAPLTAIAIQNICATVLERHAVLGGVLNLCVGAGDMVGEMMLADKRLPLISVTGSCGVGRHAAKMIGDRLGRHLLELGGNNAVIVMEDADLALAAQNILFGAIGTSGQRCTTIRRVFAHASVVDALLERLTSAYRRVTIGDPLEDGVLMGPLIDEQAVIAMSAALDEAKGQGGTILCGGVRFDRPGHFVEPAIVRMPYQTSIMYEEVFAPTLYVVPIESLHEAIALGNAVGQGLSSAIFTNNLRYAEEFLSATGSDCGIANVNMSTSGAEIGGAFGGEKDTGGGRESGSDAWKAYMRRQTICVNWSGETVLAQGISFE